MEKGVCVSHGVHIHLTFTNYLFSLKNGRKKLTIEEKMLYNYIQTSVYIYIYIRLKIKPNSVRIRFYSCQIFVLPSTGFEPTPLLHCSTIRLALRPAP